MQNKMIQDAVIRNFEIIGEATKRLSPELRSQYSLPLRKIYLYQDFQELVLTDKYWYQTGFTPSSFFLLPSRSSLLSLRDAPRTWLI